LFLVGWENFSIKRANSGKNKSINSRYKVNAFVAFHLSCKLEFNLIYSLRLFVNTC
jgi:hypothetical protein